jgi:hypothetical protein
MPDARPVPYNQTLACLRHHGFSLFGWCCDCAKQYRMDIPAEQRVIASFDISLDRLIAERGAGATYIRMRPVSCPRCGSRRTEYRLLPPSMGG